MPFLPFTGSDDTLDITVYATFLLHCSIQLPQLMGSYISLVGNEWTYLSDIQADIPSSQVRSYSCTPRRSLPSDSGWMFSFNFFQWIHVLDLETGDLLSPRAGHAGLNFLGTTGISSVVEITEAVYVMRPKLWDVSSQDTSITSSRSSSSFVRAAHALTKPAKLDLSEREDSSFKEVHVDSTQQNLLAEISALGEQKKVLESSLADVRAENSNLRNHLEDVNSTHTDLSKELQFKVNLYLRDQDAKLEESSKDARVYAVYRGEVQTLKREKAELERTWSVLDPSRNRALAVLEVDYWISI
ncbi:hypothetical protein HAX54_041296 [Datura stramonium]|uniref:Acyl-CoA-binding domain-containing protein n=1 Tax=Datura stramonium TaxID=4076 RepID=A0ABS8SKU9_DATST|nr:hypothetical protein [Datura stramonium]